MSGKTLRAGYRICHMPSFFSPSCLRRKKYLTHEGGLVKLTRILFQARNTLHQFAKRFGIIGFMRTVVSQSRPDDRIPMDILSMMQMLFHTAELRGIRCSLGSETWTLRIKWIGAGKLTTRETSVGHPFDKNKVAPEFTMPVASAPVTIVSVSVHRLNIRELL